MSALGHGSVAALALALALGACSGDADFTPGDERDAAAAPAHVAPRLPAAPGALAPSFADIPDTVEGSRVANAEACENCHTDVAAQWRTSAHAAASFDNPIYRASVDAFRAARGAVASRFCAGCHDISLLADGAIDAEVDPDDPRAHGGVTCSVCHGIERVTVDGNASYRLRPERIALPRSGDPASVEEHKRSAAPLPGVELCAACHRAFLGEATGNGHHLPGTDDFGPWRRSAYAGGRLDRIDEAVEPRDCRDCHMAPEPAPRGDPAATDGVVSSHRFLGGHTWLAAMRGDADQLERARAFLRGAASIDVAGLTRADGTRLVPPDGAPVEGGERVVLDVVVRNLRVGHRFPGGTLDAHDTWIELVVEDARGAVLARAGADHERDFDDPTAHTLRALVVGDGGRPALERDVHQFRAKVWDHTVAPRDAAGVQYAFEVPGDLGDGAWPLRVTARLHHRSRGLPLQRVACAASRGRRGRAFDAARRARGAASLDPCAPQPITTIAERSVSIGRGAEPAADDDETWRRRYEHGLAWLHVVQERLDEGRAGLEQAVRAPGRHGAMAALLLGKLAARQGRLAEAQRWLERAERAVPAHPAVAYARGYALVNVWRWSEAVAPLRAAAEAAPRDDRAWSSLATAAGSAGERELALDAARRGLALEPRHPDLLRAQAFALRALGRPGAQRALDAYVTHRRRDDAPGLRSACGRDVPGCKRERVPIHVHELRRE